MRSLPHLSLFHQATIMPVVPRSRSGQLYQAHSLLRAKASQAGDLTTHTLARSPNPRLKNELVSKSRQWAWTLMNRAAQGVRHTRG